MYRLLTFLIHKVGPLSALQFVDVTILSKISGNVECLPANYNIN